MAGIAFLLARGGDGTNDAGEGKRNSGVVAAPAPAAGGQSGARHRGGAFQPSSSWRGGEYARAWKAVRTAKLTSAERLQVQRDLLKQWAEVDLTSAIEAALAEAWDGGTQDYYDPHGPLLGSLREALAKDPAQGWEMIHGRQFGVATGMLRHVWISAVAEKDPLFLASKLGELSWRDRGEAIGACRGQFQPGSETGKKLFAQLALLPEDVVSSDVLLSFTDHATEDSTPEALKEEILGLGGQDPRLAKVLAIQWGRQISGLSPAEVAGQVAGLPEALRQEVVWAAFGRTESAENMLGLATLLAQEGAWEKLEQRSTVSWIQEFARSGSAKEVADWATTLPVRKETTELFHRSVDHYLKNNMEDSREWLGSLPQGVWRDRAYAEYSQQALNAHNNPEASRWALDQISDSTFKGEAESWRSQWEKRTGWKGN